MRRSIIAMLGLAACGRVAFDPLTDGSTVVPDGDSSRANRVFVTEMEAADGNLGGLAGADARCATAAASAGLSGTFLAWLSTPTVEARDRFAGSWGWVRVDAAPVADTLTSWLDQHQMFNAIDRTETGAIVRDRHVWTGTTGRGVRSVFGDCVGWTTAVLGSIGTYGSTDGSGRTFSDVGAAQCSTGIQKSLYCFEVGHTYVVTAERRPGRLAFISKTPRTSGNGRAGLDAICQTDAAAVGIPGSFLAAVATSNETIESRFPLDGRDWIRPDGTRIASPGNLFFGLRLDSFIHQQADGTYLDPFAVRHWTGGDAQTPGTMTCGDWTLFDATFGIIGDIGTVDANEAFAAGGTFCNSAQRVLCLEQ